MLNYTKKMSVRKRCSTSRNPFSTWSPSAYSTSILTSDRYSAETTLSTTLQSSMENWTYMSWLPTISSRDVTILACHSSTISRFNVWCVYLANLSSLMRSNLLTWKYSCRTSGLLPLENMTAKAWHRNSNNTFSRWLSRSKSKNRKRPWSRWWPSSKKNSSQSNPGTNARLRSQSSFSTTPALLRISSPWLMLSLSMAWKSASEKRSTKCWPSWRNKISKSMRVW